MTEADKIANILQITRLQLMNAMARSAELEASIMEIEQEKAGK